MKGKLITIPLLLLSTLMMTPVMAKSIGPQKAVGNPHITVTPDVGVDFLLPSLGMHSWMVHTELGSADFMNVLDASKAHIRNAMTLTLLDLTAIMTDPEVALEAESMWGYISYDVLVELLILEGFSPEEAAAMASMWPEGVYIRFVNVGKTWDS